MIISYILPAIEKAFNYYLQLDPESEQRIADLAGKTIAIEFGQFKFYWIVRKHRIHLSEHYMGEADVTLRGSIFDFLKLSTAGDDSAAVFSSGLQVTGDTEVAQQFKDLFAKLDIDWEEHLSHFTGDIFAHQVGNLVRAFCNWAKQSSEVLQQDLNEYLHEEIRLVPSREELQDFFAGVDKVRDDVERLELKIKRLEKDMA